jgi:hypothetical protein
MNESHSTQVRRPSAKTETGLKQREREIKTYSEETEVMNLEANPENMESNPEMMQSDVEHRGRGGPYGSVCSEIFGNNEEAAQGPASSCRATQRAKGTDPKRLWIPKEFGCRLQKGVPSCSSGMTQDKRLQENSDPGKLWTAEEIGSIRLKDDPEYKCGTAQGTQSQEIRPGQCGTRNPETTDIREETLQGNANGIRGRYLRKQIRGSKGIKNPGTRRQLLLKIERTWKALELEFVKRATGMSSGFRKMRN